MLGLIVVASESRPGFSPAELFEPLLGAPLLARAIAGALPVNEAVTGVLVVPADLVERAQTEVVERFGLDEIDRVVAGGADRESAVRAGLEALPDDIEWVIVQEGARALAPSGLVDRVIEAAKGADAAAPAVAIPGYVVADEDGSLTPVQARTRLRELQAPQVFQVEKLHQALAGGEAGSADLAEAVANGGGAVALVEGDADNLLLASAADVSRALEVFSRRAVDYAFVYPKDLLPGDPLAAALDPGEVPGDVDVGDAQDGADADETRADGVVPAYDDGAYDDDTGVPETDETTRMPPAPGPDESDYSH